MTTPAIAPQYVPAPLPPSVPPLLRDANAQHTTGSDGAYTDKQRLDLEMHKLFGDLWRAAHAQSRANKAAFPQPAARSHGEDTVAVNEPRMSSKERTDHELPFGPEMRQGGGDSKRAAAGESNELRWRPVFTKTETGLFQDPASIQVFFNELSSLTCSEHSCSSKPNVHLDCIGPFPDNAIEPFSYPILVDRELRSLEPDAFHATGNRLHAASFLAPFPYMYSEPPREREAVNVMASGKECEHITPYQPASCRVLSGGDPVAQIDRFFAANRNNSKPGGVVFVDGDVIDKWGTESKLLRQSGLTALAIRPDKMIYSLIGGMSGVGAFIALSLVAYYGREKLKQCPGASARLLRAGWEQFKAGAGALWELKSRALLTGPVEPAENSAQEDAGADAEESSIVIEESDSGSDDFSDFSSSSSHVDTSAHTSAHTPADTRSDDSSGSAS